ncbi:uncharacterized protein TNCV_1236401 [Trichonephila clavipes]|nr:uncharacterized protein TNCV_1236401 [Trichonephila clavipes]
MSFNCTPKNEESLKDSIDSAKKEPESVLETFACKRNERFKHDNPEDTSLLLTNFNSIMLPVYHLETHHLLVIHRQVFRHFVENCILNIPVGTELQVNGCQNEYITNTFVRKDGVAAVAEWYRYRIVACLVTSSIPVLLKTRRVGQRCTLNLSRAETSSRWCGVVVRRGGCQLRCRPRHLTMVQNYVVRRQKPSCS